MAGVDLDVECCPASEAGCAEWVDVGWWDETHLSVLDVDVPALAVDIVVASGAQHDPVGQVRGAAVIPPADVVGFAVFGWCMTLRAAPVAFHECEPLSCG